MKIEENEIHEKIVLSIVIPVYNEERVIDRTLFELQRLLYAESIFSFEIIFVNDGSRDGTKIELATLQEEIKELKIIDLSRNVGHMLSLEIGMRHSLGSFVITMDGDMQDSPSDAIRMFHEAMRLTSNHLKFQVIQAVRVNRDVDSFFKKTTAALYYKIMSAILGLPLLNAADFRLITRETVDFLLQTPESPKIFRLLIPYYGLVVVSFEVERGARIGGTTKYPFKKMFILGIDSIFTFTILPIRLMSLVGFLISTAFTCLAFLALPDYFLGKTVPGWTSIMFALISMCGLVLFSLGVIGEYVARIYRIVQKRSNSYMEVH